jgi:putative acetyltransferase
VIIRRETFGDRPAVDAVISAAFARSGGDDPPQETTLVQALRGDVGWIGSLSLVATRDRRIVGHVVCTRAWLGDLGVLGLGPLSVLPDCQRQGIGHALMHAIIGAADAAGEPLIALLGDPRFYGRFGFVAASGLGVLPPDPAWAEHFQVRTLGDCPSSIGGSFRYATPFDDL